MFFWKSIIQTCRCRLQILTEPQNVKMKKYQLYWENRISHLQFVVCALISSSSNSLPPPAASSDTGWISGRRAGSKILFMFWFSFHLLLKFWVYSKAERRNQGITLCYSSYIQLTDHDSLSLWGCLWKGGHITSLLELGVFRDTYIHRDFIEDTVSHIGFISGIIFLAG